MPEKIEQLGQETHEEKDLNEIKKVKENWKLVQIDGTKMSGLVNAEESRPPRECGNCYWYSADKCHHPVVMIDPEVIGEHGKPKPVEDAWCCGFFRSPQRTLLYMIRHGEDEADELIGGWEDADIDEGGVKDAHEVAVYLKSKGVRYIVASDMKRTLETARIIAEDLGIDKDHIITDVRLRTWNKGKFNGQMKTEENKKQLSYYRDHPHKIIPGGESHYQFEDRCDECLAYYLDYSRLNGLIAIVDHNSGMKQMQRFVNEARTGKEEDSGNSNPDSVMPGGVIKVLENRGKLSYEIVLKEAKDNKVNQVVADKGK